MTDQQLNQLPHVVWRQLSKCLSKYDIRNLILAKPDLLEMEMDTSLEKAARTATFEKVFAVLLQNSYIDSVDLIKCFQASPLMATSIIPCWHRRHIKHIADSSWKRISPFKDADFYLNNHSLPDIKKLKATCNQLEDWELLIHIGTNDYLSLKYLDELNDHNTEYFREVKFLFEKIGHFISNVSLFDKRTNRLRGTSALLENLTNLKRLTVITLGDPLLAGETIFDLDREVRDSRSLEMFYNLKVRTKHPCQLNEWITLFPYFINDQIQRIESGSNICGLNKVARQLWNVREIDLTIYPGGCKDFFKDLSGFGPNLRKLSLHYLRQCPLIHHMNRFGTTFPSLKEIHLEIRKCQRILTLDNWWPTAVFTSVEKVVLELSQKRVSHYVSSEANSPLPVPPLKFLTLFPSLKVFHFKFVHGDRCALYGDISKFKARGCLNDDFEFYDKLETHTVEESKLWDALPKLSIVQITTASNHMLQRTDRFYRK